MSFTRPSPGAGFVMGSFTGEVNVPNPYVPFDSQIPGGLQPGKRITIRGHVRHNCHSFRVDLINQNNSIALHINPRFNNSLVVRNSELGSWGNEETHGVFPFRLGEAFEIVIISENDHYKVAVNGQHLFDYQHRSPLRDVSRLGIQGDIDCHSISYSGGSIDQFSQPYPQQPYPQHKPAPHHQEHHHHHHQQHHHHHHQEYQPPTPGEVYNPPVPGAIPIHGGCRPGKMIQIQGTVPHHAKRFEIDLQTGSQYLPSELSLHFNPRWDDPTQPQPVVVRNRKKNGNWGNEERHHPPFPFNKGATFDMLILCEPNEWKVAVNGQHFISYQHDSCNVDHLYIHGDVTINSVKQFN